MIATDLHPPRAGTRPASSIARGARLLYAITACLFVAGVILQVFLGGLGLMVDGDRLADHQTAGYLVLHLPFVMLVVALFARLPRQLLLATLLLVVLATIHDVFVSMPVGGDTGFLRAFHPVTALLLFWLGISIARGTLRLHRRSPPPPQSSEAMPRRPSRPDGG